MTNFQFYKKYIARMLYITRLPHVWIIDRGEDEELTFYRDAGGYYDAKRNAIIIVRGHEHPVLIAHEYGHWFTERLRIFLDAVWDIPWWCLGMRSLLKKKESTHE
jgi:hypothetical protein